MSYMHFHAIMQFRKNICSLTEISQFEFLSVTFTYWNGTLLLLKEEEQLKQQQEQQALLEKLDQAERGETITATTEEKKKLASYWVVSLQTWFGILCHSVKILCR